jgi:hypothetical protein
MPFTSAASQPVPAPAAAREILDACFEQFRSRVTLVARNSIDQSGDLFEGNTFVTQSDVDDFRLKRATWLEKFDATLRELYARRLSGVKRKGRRPDFDASLGSLRVLTAFDHEKQAALTQATSLLFRLTRTELAALDLRFDALLPEEKRSDVDNPFAPAYLLDAIGVSSRSVYPNARVWRALMERLVEDLTPSANKLYIALNRILADRGVLPEIKAELRARSDLRPDDDRDLIATFDRMLNEATAVPADVDVPANLSEPGQAAAFRFREGAGDGTPTATASEISRALASPAILQGLQALGAMAANASATTGAGGALATSADGGAPVDGPAPPSVARAGGAADGDFPDLDPLMALGTSTPMFNTLANWQQLDLPAALAATLPKADGEALTVVPLNLVPYIRAAIADQIEHPHDRVTMDVIGLLFDYVFGDPSIPPELRRLFGRMQVPVVKAALLDRTFFTDRTHAARRLLDRLAEGAIGATSDETYRVEFDRAASAAVDTVCRDFGIDIAVFDRADRELAAFLERERSAASTATENDVATALAAEEREGDRSHVLAFVRDRLTGLDLPFEVRSFIETVWVDYLTALRKTSGEEGPEWTAAVATLDDLLWSIIAKERTGQKVRMTKLIPTLIGALRRGCVAVGAPPERSKPFFEALYPLHIAALRPPAAAKAPATPPGAAAPVPSTATAAPAKAATVAADLPPTPAAVAPAAGPGMSSTLPAAPGTPVPEPVVREPAPPADEPAPSVPSNLNDFVNDMVVGTWVAFTGDDGGTVNARLTWVSPLRTKYLFTSRSRRHAFVYSPEELAWVLGARRAQLLVEPVALFDRAVSAALDTLASARPPGTATPASAAA